MGILNGLGLFSSLNLGRRAIGNQEAGLQITGRNISNVNTPGHTRQRANVGVTDTMADAVAGERLPNVDRIRDELTERLLLQERGRLASLEKRSLLLGHVETGFTEPSDAGLNAALSDFFNAAEALANTPESAGAKSQLVESAKGLGLAFAGIVRHIDTIRFDINVEAEAIAEEINVKLEQVAAINGELLRTRDDGAASELQDRQDALIRELSEFIGVRVAQNANRTRTVQVNGLGVADGTGFGRIIVNADANNGLSVQAELDGERVDVTPQGGSLQGLIETQNEIIPAIESDIHAAALTLIDRVNALHPSFFRELTDPAQRARAAANVDVLATSGTVSPSSTGSSGGNDIALAIADLRSEPSENLADMSVQEFYRELVAAVGSKSAEMEQRRETSDLLTQQLQLRRESVSGVSLDEETTDMIMFQRAYQAAARYMAVVDGLIETLIERV